MLYAWKARNHKGKLISGTLQAASQQEAVTFVKSNYGCIVSLKEEKLVLKKFMAVLKWNQLRFPDKEKILFFDRLAIILVSGIPLLKGLQLLQSQNSGLIGKVSKKLEVGIAGGGSLAKAMQADSRMFSPLDISLVAVGEKSGELSKVLQELSRHYKKNHELQEILLKNSMYPCLVMLLSVGVLILFICFILPVLSNTYRSLGIPLTGIMLFSVNFSNYLFENCKAILLFIFFLFFIIYKFRKVWKNIFLKIGYVHRIYVMLLEIRFCKILALLLDCGINITEALTDVIATFKDEHIVKTMWVFNNMLRRGEDIGTAVRYLNNVFSPTTIEMIAIGAATGYLPKLLKDAAGFSEKTMKEELERLKQVLGPVMLVITAIIVGTVVSSVMGPLFNMVANLPDYV